MSTILTEIAGAITTVATSFLTAGSVLQYVVGLAVAGFAFGMVRRAIRR